MLGGWKWCCSGKSKPRTVNGETQIHQERSLCEWPELNLYEKLARRAERDVCVR